jgi:hypothetical protein
MGRLIAIGVLQTVTGCPGTESYWFVELRRELLPHITPMVLLANVKLSWPPKSVMFMDLVVVSSHSQSEPRRSC